MNLKIILYFLTICSTTYTKQQEFYGDIRGNTSHTIVAKVGGETASNIALATKTANTGTSSDIPNTVVMRDSNGNFATNMITLNGTPSANNDVATVAYVQTAATLGVIPKGISQVVATTNQTISGIPTIDGVNTLSDGDIVLLNGQTNQTENGLWTIHTGAWTRPTNFNTGDEASNAYVSIADGDTNGGSSWLCTTPTAIIDTDSISFTIFNGPINLDGDVIGNSTNNTVATVGGATATLIAQTVDQVAAATTTAAALSLLATNAAGGTSLTDVNSLTSPTPLTLSTNSIAAITIDHSQKVKINTFAGTAGIVHNDSSGELSSGPISGIDITDGSITNAKLKTISSSNVHGDIVVRDGSGNFSAGTITANLTGNVTGNATTATNATNFTGSLSGDVTGTQSATVVASVGGSTASDINTATIAANAATSADTASTIVKRDGSGNFSAGTITAALTGAASSNVLKTGDTMSGALILPAGSANSPSLKFTGGTNTGISSGIANTLSFETNGTERLNINSSGTVAINGLAGTAGIVHNDASGNLSSSLIVNADISSSAAIADSKLAEITTAGKVANSATTATNLDIASTIVVRDGSGNFATNMITLDGTPSASTDATTVAYVQQFAGLGLNPKEPAIVVATTDSAISGLLNIDGVTLVDGDRVLLVAQTDSIDNGLWVANSGTWTRPTDFATGSAAQGVYVLITNGTDYKGSSWICNTTKPDDIVDTNSLSFVQFSLPSQETAANVGSGTGEVFENKVGQTLNLRTIEGDSYLTVATDSTPNTISLATNASTTGASNIVARDASGNFSAGTITADLIGNATTATNATNFTGLLIGNVTGTQGNTVVSYVGNSTASDVSSATALALAATSSNILNTIVKRDGSGNFSAGTITGNLTGSASNNVLKTGDTMTGALQLSTGSSVSPSIQYATGFNTGIFFANDNTIGFMTNNIESMVMAYDHVTINSLAGTAGIVHNDDSGNLSSSLIVNADISDSAAIADSKLATISTSGKVDNSATTATSSNIANTIVARAFDGSFEAARILTNNGSSATPSYSFSNSTNTGVYSSSTNNLSFSTNGNERVNISPSGTVAINNLSTGIVHSDTSGNLTSSLIVNADISDSTISNDKLATISSNNTAGAIVARDGSGNFATNMITLNGTPSAATDATTVAYVQAFAGLGLNPKGPAVVVAITDSAITGLYTIDDVTLVDGNRVLLVGQTNAINNGLWVAHSGAWTRPDDFLAGSAAQGAYVLITASTNYKGSSWICNTTKPNDIVDTNELSFVQFSLPSQETAANVGSGTGEVFENKVGQTLNLRTIEGDSYLTVATDSTPNTISLATNASTAGTSNIVARDGSGNFSAGTITADLIGNATTATNATNFTGLLIGNVTGTQGNTVVSYVGNSTASDVSSATALALAATSSNILNTIVKRDGSGDFSAGTITADLIGSVTLPASVAGAASLNFSDSLTTGISGTANTLSFDTNNAERMSINSTGTVAINGLAGTAGIVHNDDSGNLSSSLIVNADISGSAAIADSKLATISTGGKVANSATTATNSNTASAIVARDGSGNFSANMITLNGTPSASTDAATVAYVQQFAGLGLNTKDPALVVAITNSAITGLYTIDDVTLVDGNRVLLIGQTNAINNGLWVAHSGAWTRPTDFATGSSAQGAYVLITSGTNYSGSSWICNTTAPNDIVDTDPIEFVQFSLPSQVTAANVGNGTGEIFKNKVGQTLNLRTIAGDSYLAVTTDSPTNTISLTTNATSSNTNSAIVARDGSGNFSAGTITAALTGAASSNVLKSGDTMSGALILPAGSANSPSLKFTGGTNTGISSGIANTLSFETNGTERLNIGSTGTVAMNSLAGTAGIVHNDASGNLSSSLIVNADISGSAAIADSKLATISTSGKVANSATTATSTNTNSAIVARDSSGNFSAGSITAATSLVLQGLLINQAIQLVNITSSSGQGISVSANTGVLVLRANVAVTSIQIPFPGSPTNGQIFTILSDGSNSINGITYASPTSVIGGVTSFVPPTNYSATYIFMNSSPLSGWYRISQG